MSFLQTEKRHQTEWKLRTSHLSQDARKAGLLGNKLYPFCLPVDHSLENLYPGIRDRLLQYFLASGIAWHKSALPGYPSNHLCSSQVFLVNLLGPFQWDRESLLAVAKLILPEAAEILPIEQPGQFLAFEWVPPVDVLRELSPGRGRRKLTRGVGNTSMDFAFLARNRTSQTVLVLGESKYTEDYPRRLVDPVLASKRLSRLESLLEPLPWLPVRSPGNRQLLATEPVYQLLRHHIMALRLRESFQKIDDVHLVHLFVGRPLAYSGETSPILTDHPGVDLLADSPITLHQVSAQRLFHWVHPSLPARFDGWAEYLEERYRL